MVKSEDGEETVVSFSYDPFGRRIAKQIEEPGHAAHVFTYLYDNEDIIAISENSGSLSGKRHGKGRGANKTSRILHGPGIDEPLAIEQQGRLYYYHADGLGSIATITDHKGKVVESYEYSSFGETRRHGNKVKQPYGYTGREWDHEIGLYFYRARYYDSEVGRFIGKDPIGLRGGINLFAYTANNPINKSDPSGLKVDSYGGWEAQFIGGYGHSTVICCDGCRLWKHEYRKVCFGAGFVAGVSSGGSLCETANSCKNPPKKLIVTELGAGIYGPIGVEGGFSFDIDGDADTPYIGGSGGTGFKATVCYYWLVESREVGSCSN